MSTTTDDEKTHKEEEAKGSVAKNKKQLFLIFQLTVFQHLLISFFIKNNFCNRARIFTVISFSEIRQIITDRIDCK